MKIKKFIPIVLSFLMAGTVFAGCANNTGDTPGTTDPGTTDPGTTEPGTPVPSTPLPAGKKIYVVGDSTACEYKDKNDPTKPSDNYYLPRYGYGTQLAEYLNVESSQIVNLAISGRSSKSFLTETNYQTLKDSIAEGDYLIIGFGHNDEKSAEPARFTDPAGTKDQETTSKGTSLKWNLYQNYIKVATDKGATPILCTPIVRYDPEGNYTGSVVHNTADGDYAKAIKDLGEETDTAVVDLTALTQAVYMADNTNAVYYHAHTTYYTETDADIIPGSTDGSPIYNGMEKPDGLDKTHINKYGAKMVAYQFATAIKASDCSLKAHVKDDIVAPSKFEDYLGSIKQDYVKLPYLGFAPADYSDRVLTGDWYRTVIGNIGGKKANLFTISYSQADSKFTVGNPDSNNGKIAGTEDGFGAAFVQIDKNKDFNASATVTVTAVAAGDKAVTNQSAFGMMLRDDIYIDGVPEETYTGKEKITTNYVAAGVFAVDNTALFSRENTTLTKETNAVNAVAVGSTYTVSINRVGQTVTTTISDGTHDYTKTYTDFDFVARDNDYMYLCLFANRGLVVDFTNVQFEITGDSQGA